MIAPQLNDCYTRSWASAAAAIFTALIQPTLLTEAHKKV